jgi:hypothetical protein
MPYSPDWSGFLVKYTEQNGFLWAKSLGGAINGVAVDYQNNIFVTGSFAGVVDFGGLTLSSALDPSGRPGADIFVAKYSASGGLLWAKKFGGVLNDEGIAIAVNGNGDAFVASQYASVIDFGTVPLSNAGSLDMAIVKLSGATGTTQWATRWGNSFYDLPKGITVDRYGDVLVTGQGDNDLGSGTSKLFIGKFTGTTGASQWTKLLGTKASGNGIAVDPNTGNIFVTGGFSGSADFGGGVVSTFYSGGVIMAAYNPSGNWLWNRAYGGTGDSGAAITLDGNGNLAITGGSSYPLDFVGNGSYLYTGYYFVANFTVSGNSPPSYRWARRANANRGTGIAFDEAGHVITTGNFGGSTSLVVDFGGVSASVLSGVTDGFVVQYEK